MYERKWWEIPGLVTRSRPEYCIAPLEAPHSQGKLFLHVLWHHLQFCTQRSVGELSKLIESQDKHIIIHLILQVIMSVQHLL